jgi:NADH:ubiquinone reductase (H+-translocating)
MNRIPQVVIVGGGFGGLSAARALRRAPVRITLVDRRNHHLFQPLLYQVATAALSPADISAPIRGILRRQRNLDVRMAEVADVDTGARQLVLADGSRLAYDFLVVATGATHAYFGHPEWAPLAPGLKTIEDATEIRRRFLLAFEAAEQEDDVEERRSLLTFVVVGAGPTGVEMAGSMAEIARHAIVRDFRRIDPSTARILLVEGGPRVLPAYDPALSAYAERALARTGVEVRTGQVVTQIDPEGVVVGGERIRSRNVVWAAGVAASPLGACLGGPTDRVGRVRVSPDLTVPVAPEVYAIGDLAAMDDARGRPLPGVAPVANQQGRHAAANILRTLAGEPRRPFRYVDKGSMATIGRSAAVMQVGRLRLKGLIAWLGWLFVHILVLIGFRNRVAVMMEWAYSYLTWQRGARLITGEVGPELAPPGRPIGSPEPGAGQAVEGAARADAAPPEDAAAGSMGGGRHRAPAPEP